MKTLILENDELAAKHLKTLLQQIDGSIEVINTLNNVKDSISWFDNCAMPDLVIAETSLNDGSTFSIFEKKHIPVPVIFVTASNNHALDAFKVLSIDYLLKPVTGNSLSSAINKLKQFHSFQKPVVDLTNLARFISKPKENYKTKFLCRTGRKEFFIFSKDICFFCADNKLVYLVCSDETKYIIDYTMEVLESLIDPSEFFRANRSIIINVMFIKLIKPYTNHRLKLFMKDGSKTKEVIVSRERVPDFRKWCKD